MKRVFLLILLGIMSFSISATGSALSNIQQSDHQAIALESNVDAESADCQQNLGHSSLQQSSPLAQLISKEYMLGVGGVTLFAAAVFITMYAYTISETEA